MVQTTFLEKSLLGIDVGFEGLKNRPTELGSPVACAEIEEKKVKTKIARYIISSDRNGEAMQ